MALNYIWIGLILVAFVVGVVRLIFFGDVQGFIDIVNSTFDSSKQGFEISLGLTGVLALWMGLMKIGERGGMIRLFSRAVYPLFSRLFPGIPKDHPASGSIILNISANLLGLDNAATPAGLQAMRELQELNKDKNTASDSMIMFLVMHASGLTLIPVSVMTIRAQMGASNPADVFIPILISTFFAAVAGILAVCIKQRINIFDKVLMGTFAGAITLVGGLIWAFESLGKETMQVASNLIASIILFGVIILFLVSALRKKVNVYDAFIDGAKDGFQTAIKIIPYLIAILVAIAMFRTSGAMDFLLNGVKHLVAFTGCDTSWVDALPTAIMKPLSGSGARGMMVEAMKTYGPDSFVGRLSGIFQGSTDTTFYLVAVYYGAVNIKNSRYTVPYALLCDLVAVVTAVLVGYMFFG